MASIDGPLLFHMCEFKCKKPKFVYLNSTLFPVLPKVNKLAGPDRTNPTYWLISFIVSFHLVVYAMFSIKITNRKIRPSIPNPCKNLITKPS